MLHGFHCLERVSVCCQGSLRCGLGVVIVFRRISVRGLLWGEFILRDFFGGFVLPLEAFDQDLSRCGLLWCDPVQFPVEKACPGRDFNEPQYW